jgi:replicative DNA helicase
MSREDLDKSTLRALVATARASTTGAVEILDDVGVSASDCETPAGRELWAAVEAAIRAGEQPDAVVLAGRCRTAGRDYVLDVVTGATSELGLGEQRMRLLRERSLRRQYLGALRVVAQVVTDNTQPLANAVTEAQRLLASWQDETAGIRPMDDSVLALLDQLDAVQSGKREPTLRTGIDALDAVIGGLPPTLTVVGGLPGVGKSAFLGGLVRLLTSRNVKVGFLSLEDEREWLTRRLLAHAANVPLFVLANRPLGSHQLARINDVGAVVHGLLSRVICDARQGLTTAEVVASARRMVAMGARAVLVDHLGEIRLERSDRHDLDIADALRELRGLAKSHHVPVVVATHLRRRENFQPWSEPRLTDFAFSSGVERMARVALGLWRVEDDPTTLKVTVLKQTQGVAGVTMDLRMAASSGLVIETEASTSAQALYDTKETT